MATTIRIPESVEDVCVRYGVSHDTMDVVYTVAMQHKNKINPQHNDQRWLAIKRDLNKCGIKMTSNVVNTITEIWFRAERSNSAW